jgi:VanZ family protein
MNILKFIGRGLIWLPAVFVAIAIFSFSAQDGDESQSLSDKAADCILTSCDKIGFVDYINSGNQEEMIENISTPIRKMAHMTEFGVLTMCIFIAFMYDGLYFKLSRICSLLMCVLWASLDEIHQLYVPGRAGRFLDVCIDTGGALVFIWIVSFIHHHLEVKKEKAIYSALN